jgi:hypothetical protein
MRYQVCETKSLTPCGAEDAPPMISFGVVWIQLEAAQSIHAEQVQPEAFCLIGMVQLPPAVEAPDPYSAESQF